MINISINKNLFEDILLKKVTLLEKKTSKYWKKELIIPIISGNKISYRIKQLDKLRISNGLGDNRPSLVIKCVEIKYNGKNDKFEFQLGKIIEQKNIEHEKDYKDKLIEKLLKEKAQLESNMLKIKDIITTKTQKER